MYSLPKIVWQVLKFLNLLLFTDAGDCESAIDFLADVLDDPDEPKPGNCSSSREDDLKSYNETVAFLEEVSGRRNEEEEEEEEETCRVPLDTHRLKEELPNKYHQPTWKTNVNKTLAPVVSNGKTEKHVKVDSILGLRVMWVISRNATLIFLIV